MNDVLIFGHTQQKHDRWLHSGVSKIQKAGLKLNADKCEFNKSEVSFPGHAINHHGISHDPQKTDAVLSMDKP